MGENKGESKHFDPRDPNKKQKPGALIKWDGISPPVYMNAGSSGPAVEMLAVKLMELGYLEPLCGTLSSP